MNTLLFYGISAGLARIFGMLCALLFCVTCSNGGSGDGLIPVGRAYSPDPNLPRPKNVILLIGDGMGYNHVVASSVYRYGSDDARPYGSFPIQLAMTTYPAGGHYRAADMWADFDWAISGVMTDSAAAGTAMSTGSKTIVGRIGMDPSGNPLTHVIQIARLSGKATAVVTSVEIYNATPAAFTAHSLRRNSYKDISSEMINVCGVDVIMGTGHPYYDNNGNERLDANLNPAPDYEGFYEADYTAVAAGLKGFTFIDSLSDFEDLADGTMTPPARLFGLARVADCLQCRRAGTSAIPFFDPSISTVPTLATLALGALNLVSRNPEGFFIMIEGGGIDRMSHLNHLARTIEEMMNFEDAVTAVITWVEANSSWEETLLIITADHETGYLWGSGSGRPAVFNPIGTNGAGTLPDMVFYSTGHSNSLVPVYIRGYGAQQLLPYADKTDPVRGRYLDNAELGEFLKWAVDDLDEELP